MLFGSDRAALRRAFSDAWARRVQGLPLDAAQVRIADVVAMHPEYHPVLADPDNLQREFGPHTGASNPFLHMALHLALCEQRASNRPPGVTRALEDLVRLHAGDAHAAEHEAMECLAQALWDAQRASTMPDDARYLECLRARARRR